MRTPQPRIGVEAIFRFPSLSEHPSHLQPAARVSAVSSDNYSLEHTPTLRVGGAQLESLELKGNSVKNIEIFKAVSGLALAKAYDSFPIKISIRPSDLALELDDEYWEESLREISENHHEYVRNRSPSGLAKPTIQWLIDSGFLSCEKYENSIFSGVRLTAKGLESIESDESRGKQLLDAVTDLAKGELKEQARQQLTKAFAGAMSWSIKNVPTIINNISKFGQV